MRGLIYYEYNYRLFPIFFKKILYSTIDKDFNIQISINDKPGNHYLIANQLVLHFIYCCNVMRIDANVKNGQ